MGKEEKKTGLQRDEPLSSWSRTLTISKGVDTGVESTPTDAPAIKYCQDARGLPPFISF